MGARAVQGPQSPLWSSLVLVCMSEGDVCHQKGKHTPVWPLHCVHSISSEGSPETPVSDGYDATRYDDESLRPWDGALRGVLLFGLSGRRGNLCFPSILGVMTTV